MGKQNWKPFRLLNQDFASLKINFSHSENIVEEEVPERLVEMMNKKRQELLENLADCDDSIAEKVLEGVEPTIEVQKEKKKNSLTRLTMFFFFPILFVSKGIENRNQKGHTQSQVRPSLYGNRFEKSRNSGKKSK